MGCDSGWIPWERLFSRYTFCSDWLVIHIFFPSKQPKSLQVTLSGLHININYCINMYFDQRKISLRWESNSCDEIYPDIPLDPEPHGTRIEILQACLKHLLWFHWCEFCFLRPFFQRHVLCKMSTQLYCIKNERHIQFANIIYTENVSYTHQYLGIGDLVTMPVTGPEWIPIRSFSPEFCILEILKSHFSPTRSKAIDAISTTCLVP